MEFAYVPAAQGMQAKAPAMRAHEGWRRERERAEKGGWGREKKEGPRQM